jgi:hypothetical protein
MVKTIGMFAFNLGCPPSAYIIFKKKKRAIKAQLEIEEGIV